ncbi:HYR domain-containing protein [Geomonas anaerohicana]|uniref:HYR domain-containing protein n=1 Tax=Geomonas anaerohicana TaxID=2798583 RepID=A0ABS0YGE2_9BACT|nr:HYR domain-containing protein [Geomonas anaerohicana]MBJ6751389.1 HYR domain-containing protein [Geomonas anaerohicana]
MRRELLSVMVWLLMASPVLAAPPACNVEPHISPDNQSVDEKSASGVPTLVKLNGQPSKDAATYLWEQTAGPAVTLNDPRAAQPTFSAPEVGPSGATLTFKLTVTGCSPLQTRSLTTNVNVANVVTNRAPVASATYAPSQVYEGTTVTLDGSSSSDPDGNPLTYTWSQLTGPAVTLTADGAKATFTAPAQVPFPDGASLSFHLIVSDGSLSSSTDQIVNVLWVNDPPKAALSCPETVNEGAQITLNGSGSSDSDNGIASYNWSQSLGTPNATLPSYDQATAKTLSFAAPYLDSVNDTMTFKLLVTDAGALTDSKQCSVKVLDITAPVLSNLPSDITAEATSAAGAEVGFTLPGAKDNVDGDLTVACTPGSGTLFPLGTSTVTCSVSDAAKNAASGNFSIKVQDTTAPAVTAPAAVVAEATAPRSPVAIGTATATDAVGVKEITSDAPLLYPVGTTVVTWSASDAAGNAGHAKQSVTVQDTTAPVVTAPAAVLVEATAPLSPVTIGTATATDAVGVKEITSDAPALYPVGTTEVVWTASDEAGNKGSAKQSITVQDTTAPVVTAPAAIVVEATAPNSPVALGTATATDAVGVKEITSDAPLLYPVGTTVVIWSASDAAGNVGHAKQSVTVQDTTAPVVSAPAAVLVEATAPLSPVTIGTATATDAVGVKEITSDAPALYPVGTTEVVWTASDEAGNKGTAKQSITVQDTTAPVVTAPAAIVVEATAPNSPVAIGTATATDAVGVKEITSDAPLLYPVGTTVVTWSASDAAGNTGKAKQSVTVQDTTAPALTAPAAVVVEATAPQSPVSIGTATATDAVGVKSLTNDAPALYPVGTTVVTWTARDEAGNTSTAKQSVTVKDTTAPVVTPPAAVTIEATGPSTSIAFATAGSGAATASDAVGVTSLTSDAPASFPIGTTVVTWTAKDAAGNTGTATQSITVKDTTAPKLDGVPKGLTLIIGQSATYAPTATDLVDGSVPVTCSPASGSSLPLGTTTVTCSAKDAHGNTSSAKFDVNVQYGFNGLLAPYDANKAYKIKSAIPLKWQFTNSTGTVLVSAGARPAVTIYQVSNGVDSPDAITLDDAGASGLQYDSLTNTWQFNWKTTGLSAGVYNVYIESNLTGQKTGPFPIKLAK